MSSDLIRLTGINSGLDTESIISAYTSKANLRLKNARASLTKNQWTQTAWQSLNSKIYSFYSGTAANNRLSSAYSKKATKSSSSALSVIAGQNAVDGVQTAQIKATAKAAYFTGASMKTTDDGSTTERNIKANENLVDALKLTGDDNSFQFTTSKGTQTFKLMSQDAYDALTAEDKQLMADNNVTAVSSMSDLVKGLKDLGVNANYDEANGRLFVSAKETGKDQDFSFTASGANWQASLDTLNKFGLLSKEEADKFATAVKEQVPEYADKTNDEIKEMLGWDNLASKIDGSNAKLVLNGAEFESNSNTFSINGSTYTINHMPATDEEISITTNTDYDAVYGVIKDMIKEYNSLVNEMSKLYGADKAKDYDPLTSEQKKEMSESEIEEWETKIKDGLLSGDKNLYDARQAMVDATLSAYTVKDANGNETKMYLTDFGIATGGYFSVEENERYALHIDGDKDDSVTGGNADKLKNMIATDPEKVSQFFQAFSAKLYDNLYAEMRTSKLSSIYKVYNDKQLASEETDWKKKIADIEDEIEAIEDKWYDKFASMETALAKLNGNSSAVTGMLGG
ncbi:MAG: flagellar filament capping protein FliD [Lachnospiraceae bacterium]|nr:flagellar filament capping protein FliD [Lachnospiraceae bacterium]